MTTYPHVIRLREPWQRETLAAGVRLRRGFNRPSGLDQCEQVWLVVELPAAVGKVFCNGHPLGSLAELSGAGFNITSWLADRNEVCIEIEGGAPAALSPEAGERGLARLEIRLG